MRRIGWAIILVWLTSGAALGQAARDPRALATYEEGKKLYDRGRYAEALDHFDEAARVEPGAARWQYNRGLALRRLGRAAEAREALLKSRTLDPEYKRAEIDKRLSELGGVPAPAERPPESPSRAAESPPPGPPPAETASPQPSAAEPEPGFFEGLWDSPFTWFVVFFLAIVGFGIWNAKRQAWKIARQISRAQQRLEALPDRLARVERAFAAGEDQEARARLEQATRAEQLAGKLLPRARVKPKKLPELEAALSDADQSAGLAEERLKARFGAAPPVKPERAGCYFCARPLPNRESRIQVAVKQGGASFPAVVCSDCAAQAEAGEPPRVTVVDVDGRPVHWSEVPDFDPYLNRHQPFPGASRVNLHRFSPAGRSLSEIALLAAGGALALGAGAALAGGPGRALDLDALRATAAAHAAARASAEASTGGGPWRDQS